MEMCLNVNLDIISNLPANVTDQILVRLPIIDAVRTSALSTKWRYKWTAIPELVFHDDQLVLPSPHDNMNKLIYLVNRVLLLHTGFIHKFELSSKWLQSSSTIDCWILFLLRKNIKELVLKFSYWDGKKYKLPSCFFSAQQISTLELHWCVLKPPLTFTGYGNLKSLYLHNTSFVNEGGFKCLISKCPVLERLTWLYISGLDNLNICSPNLKYLFLSGCFEDICFENTPLLSDVTIYLTKNFSDEELKKFLHSETGNVVKVLGSLPHLRKFVVGRFFLRFLAVGKIPEKLPFTCHHLNNLSLELNFECVDDMCVTLYLLNSSPNLQELEIEFNPLSKLSGHNSESFWEGQTLVDWNMSGLQIVKITYNKGFGFGFGLELELELVFIKLLLANSPVLEMLTIRSGQLDNDRKGLNFLKELLTFPRASPKARIKFFERNEK